MNSLLIISLFTGEETGTTQAKGIFIAAMWVFVFIAMSIDLVSGIRKARRANIDRTSELMRRTTNKVVKNYGALLFMFMLDVVIMHIGRFTTLDLISNIPIATVIMSCFIIYVEYRSFRENIGEKQRTKDKEALNEIQEFIKSLKKQKTTDEKIIEVLKVLNGEKEEKNETIK